MGTSMTVTKSQIMRQNRKNNPSSYVKSHKTKSLFSNSHSKVLEKQKKKNHIEEHLPQEIKQEDKSEEYRGNLSNMIQQMYEEVGKKYIENIENIQTVQIQSVDCSSAKSKYVSEVIQKRKKQLKQKKAKRSQQSQRKIRKIAQNLKIKSQNLKSSSNEEYQRKKESQGLNLVTFKKVPQTNTINFFQNEERKSSFEANNILTNGSQKKQNKLSAQVESFNGFLPINTNFKKSTDLQTKLKKKNKEQRPKNLIVF